MEDYQEEMSNLTEIDGQLTNNEVSNIYHVLSSPASFADIDTNDELSFVQKCIDSLYNQNFKLIESTELQRNHTLLNTKFVELVKFCKQSFNYKKIGYIFIGFCYYFDLDECIVYKSFHEKIQQLIQQATIRMCGKEVYKRSLQNSQSKKDIHITSLFSLTSK